MPDSPVTRPVKCKIPRERLAFVRKLLLRPMAEATIVAAVVKTYPVKERQAWTYVRLVREKLRTILKDEDPLVVKAQCRAMLCEAAEIARKNGDAKTLMAVEQRWAVLHGIDGDSLFARVRAEMERWKLDQLKAGKPSDITETQHAVKGLGPGGILALVESITKAGGSPESQASISEAPGER